MTGLKKKDFAKLISIRNPYRKDVDDIGLKMEMALANYFEGIDKQWLLTDHPEGTKGIKFTSRKRRPDAPTDAHIPLTPADNLIHLKINEHPENYQHQETEQYIRKCRHVLNSGTGYADALKKNLDWFTKEGRVLFQKSTRTAKGEQASDRGHPILFKQR